MAPPLRRSFYCHDQHLGLRSFPTRRSSDLKARFAASGTPAASTTVVRSPLRCQAKVALLAALAATATVVPSRATTPGRRSEEHTSELQSRRDLVCRLLLEKKKTLA